MKPPKVMKLEKKLAKLEAKIKAIKIPTGRIPTLK